MNCIKKLLAVTLTLILVICSGCVWMIRRNREKQKNAPQVTAVGRREIRCPTCGSPAVYENGHWECGYCGDSGSGLHNVI